MENRLNEIMYEPFALAIVTYALHTSESVRADEALIFLEALATEKGELSVRRREGALLSDK